MIRRVVRLLLDLTLIALVAAVVLTAAIGPVAGLTGRRTFIIGGGSMAPTIALGSLVVVEPTGGRLIETGEVATFRTPAGTVVTHRVVRVVHRSDGVWYETKGDGNTDPDPALWPATALVGRVAVAAPGLGLATWLLHLPLGWINVITLFAWLLVARRLVRDPSFWAGPSVRAAGAASAAGDEDLQGAVPA